MKMRWWGLIDGEIEGKLRREVETVSEDDVDVTVTGV